MYATTSLHQLLERLQEEGELLVIDAPVDPHLEIAQIHRSVVQQQGPALLFTKPITGDVPVVTNLYGSKRRIELAFGQGTEERLQQCLALLFDPPPTLTQLWKQRHSLYAVMRHRITYTRHSAWEDCTTPLEKLPILTSWPEDGGPFITLPIVHTTDPHLRHPNWGMYRAQVFDNASLGFHCQSGKGARYHLMQWDKPMPTTLMVCGAPHWVLSAIAPLPENVPESLFAAWLAGKPVTLWQPNNFPAIAADAEYAFCGYVDPSKRRPEGPFGDHYGYYTPQEAYPYITIQKAYRKKNAILPATVVGPGRQEDAYLGEYLQQLFLPILKHLIPPLCDLWSYSETGFHALTAAVIQERHLFERLTIALRLLSEGQLGLGKCLLVIDTPLNLRNPSGVLTHLLARFDPRIDCHLLANAPADSLDPGIPITHHGSKIIFFGTGPVKQRCRTTVPRLPRTIQDAFVPIPGCLCCNTDVENPFPEGYEGFPFLLLGKNLREENWIHQLFTQINPASDSIITQHSVVFTLHPKPHHHTPLLEDPATVAKVHRRWREYFPAQESQFFQVP